MLITVTLTEVAAGALSLAGAVQLAMNDGKALAIYGAQLASINVLLLFFGQRIAKEYAGAAVLVSYFILCVGAVVLLSW
jgi:hypothetical protein